MIAQLSSGTSRINAESRTAHEALPSRTRAMAAEAQSLFVSSFFTLLVALNN